MALHGEIFVNQDRIGSYLIKRLEDLEPDKLEYEYEYIVKYPIRYAKPRVGRLRHYYNDGAIVLIMKAFQAADDENSVDI